MMELILNTRLRLLITLLLLVVSNTSYAERIKDLASVAGVRTNQLVGYGLVVGLDGTGDQTSQTPFTVQSLKSMLSNFGIELEAGSKPQLKNIAAVSLHAELPPFAKPGQTIDITVSSIGNAKSLRGGTLLMSPLKGIDGQVYAMAQGNLVVGGLGVRGADGSRVSVNIPSVGRIPNGAIVERSVPMMIGGDKYIGLNLRTPDFTTASRVVDKINSVFGEGVSKAIDLTTIKVLAPEESSQRIAYLAELENLEVEPGEAAARVIINSRTGTIVIGQNVKVLPAAVTHGSLTVSVTEHQGVSQPQAFSRGRTVVTGESDIAIEQETSRAFLLDPGVSLADIVRSINRVGIAPGDLVAILEALKSAGALKAELVII